MVSDAGPISSSTLQKPFAIYLNEEAFEREISVNSLNCNARQEQVNGEVGKTQWVSVTTLPLA